MKVIKKGLIFVGLLTIVLVSINALQEPPTDEFVEKKIINDYNVYALHVPENLDFAGEKIPLDNPDIYERMDRELLVNTYWQSNGLLLFKRAHKFFPVIEPILEEYGVPNDFKYLAIIESGLQNVKSPAGASGFWQIMKQTGREYGLEVNNNVDERYHLEKATRVACKYLKAAKDNLGSWTLAAAAYNAGNAGISRRLKSQQVTEYYDLLLGEETGRYMFRIVALKEIMSNPDKYGFNFRTKDLYKNIETKSIEVDSVISDFASFSKKHGINYKILKLHNPWLREPHLNNKSRKLYTIEIPLEGSYD
ncbi:lytic transglycosylase domain-containing protein [Aurantibacter sp.]|uniref:lytic transglycosylase domain-containing protein n=1 Tax=Aurantibacter sp. TaxID=2807103 RepID=UPI0035C7FE23